MLVTYDLLLPLETSKVYSGFLNDGVLLLNVWFSQLQVRMAIALSGTSKRVCLSTIRVLFSSSHTQFLLYLSQIAQLVFTYPSALVLVTGLVVSVEGLTRFLVNHKSVSDRPGWHHVWWHPETVKVTQTSRGLYEH